MAEYDVFIPATYNLEFENDDFDEIYTAFIKAYAKGKIAPIQGEFQITRDGCIKFKNAPVKFEYKGDTYYLNFASANLLIDFAELVGFEHCTVAATRRVEEVEMIKRE